ncbi:MAG: RNA-binding protein, partial [Halobacteriota archaeon]
MNLRVRGVCSTSLCRLALELGFDVVEPSDVQRERFDVFDDGDPDVVVRDSCDRLGVYVHGEGASEVASEFSDALGETAFVWRSTAPEGGHVEAEVLETRGGGAIVGFDGGEAYLPFSEVDGYVERGDDVDVWIETDHAPWCDRRPTATSELRVGGDVGLRRGSRPRVRGGDDADHRELSMSVDLMDYEPPGGWSPSVEGDALSLSTEAVGRRLEDAGREA